MENVISRSEAGSMADVVKGLETLASEQTNKLARLFKTTLAHERGTIELGNPSAHEKSEFLAVLKRLYSALEFAAKFAPRVDTEELEWMARRIKMSIDSLENPMTEAEADEFLDKHFPA